MLLAGHLAKQGGALAAHGRGLLPGDRDRLGLSTCDRGRFRGPVLRRHGSRRLASRLLVGERLGEGWLVGRGELLVGDPSLGQRAVKLLLLGLHPGGYVGRGQRLRGRLRGA